MSARINTVHEREPAGVGNGDVSQRARARLTERRSSRTWASALTRASARERARARENASECASVSIIKQQTTALRTRLLDCRQREAAAKQFLTRICEADRAQVCFFLLAGLRVRWAQQRVNTQETKQQTIE